MITAVKSLGKCNNTTGYYRRDEGEKKENIAYNSTEIIRIIEPDCEQHESSFSFSHT